MELTDPGTLRALLERHGLRPTKRWGQHFLVSARVVRAILERLEGYTGVLEVGPGPGVLTRPLSESARVLAFEVDPVAVSALSESAPRAQVRHEDVLQADLAGALATLPEPRALVSNMPYNITGPLLTRFAEVRSGYERAVLMMQREVGTRVLAKPGEREFGSLSVFLAAQFDIVKVCDAPNGAFFPPPRVESVVLQFKPKPTGLAPEAEARFFRLVRSGFTQPRKTLLNNLTGLVGRDRATALIEGLPEGVRPHQVPVDRWKEMAMCDGEFDA